MIFMYRWHRCVVCYQRGYVLLSARYINKSYQHNVIFVTKYCSLIILIMLIMLKMLELFCRVSVAVGMERKLGYWYYYQTKLISGKIVAFTHYYFLFWLLRFTAAAVDSKINTRHIRSHNLE